MKAAHIAWRCFRAGCIAYVLTVWIAFAYVWGLPVLKDRHENRQQHAA